MQQNDKIELHKNFKKILELAGLNPANAEKVTVLGSGEIKFRMGSVYTRGDWTYNEETGIATRTTCGFINEEDKVIYTDCFVNCNNKLVKVHSEML